MQARCGPTCGACDFDGPYNGDDDGECDLAYETGANRDSDGDGDGEGDYSGSDDSDCYYYDDDGDASTQRAAPWSSLVTLVYLCIGVWWFRC
jgi:hypothetical protein